MGSIVLNQSINCLCGDVRLYLALRKRVRQVCTVGYFRSQLQNKVMPDYTSEGSAVASNVTSDISQQATEGSEDDPVSQR